MNITTATREEKKAYYKARQQKAEARAAAAHAAYIYDPAVNPRNIDPALLAHQITVEINHSYGLIPSTFTLAEFLRHDGQPSNGFWTRWKGEDDTYGLNRGFSFKRQIQEAGLTVAKLSDGRWTLILNGTALLS